MDLRNGRAKTFQLALLTYQSGFWASAPKPVIIFGEKIEMISNNRKKQGRGLIQKLFSVINIMFAHQMEFWKLENIDLKKGF